MNLINVLNANGSFDAPQTVDSIIIDYFNSLGWWGNLILIALSIFLATLLGGLLGYQREVNGHAAGFRTHILISIGSALIMVISIYGVPGEVTRDPMRLAAAGVTGIGFLGAGTIIKNGVTIKGLTTAASIWVTMAIGMASGAGYFVIAIITTVVALLCLVSFIKLENFVSKKYTNILIVVKENQTIMKPLLTLLDKYELAFKEFNTSIVDMDGEKVFRITFRVSDKRKEIIDAFMVEFKEEVKPVNIQILR